MVPELIWSVPQSNDASSSNESLSAPVTGLGSFAGDGGGLHRRIHERPEDQRDLKQVLDRLRTRGRIGLRLEVGLCSRSDTHILCVHWGHAFFILLSFPILCYVLSRFE